MSVEIIVCPIKKLRELSKNESEACAAVISSSDAPDKEYLPTFPYVLRIYEDIDREVPGRSFSYEDARAFADFIRALPKTASRLYFCCNAGESRSPAKAAAVMRYFGLDDLVLWRDPRYHPNMLVYVMLCEALGVTIGDDDIDLRMYENIKAFRDALGASDEKCDKR